YWMVISMARQNRFQACRSGFYGLEYGIEVKLVTQFEELIPQLCQVYGRRDVDRHLRREHGSAGVGRGVTAGGEFRDVDATARKEAGEVEHDARLVEGHHVDAIRDAIGFI